MCSVENKPLFRDLTAEDPDPEVTEVESMCMNCQANGMTRLLLTRIPYYKNVVLMSFSCEHCGHENNEIQSGGAHAEKGIRWTLRVEDRSDLDRQVVKSDYTKVSIPEVELEIPAQSQKGEVTTVEGILARTISGLLQDQESRRQQHPAEADQIQQYVARLERLKAGEEHFTLLLDDISGECFVENPCAPRVDPRCRNTRYTRTRDQDHALGIYTQHEVCGEAGEGEAGGATASVLLSREEVNKHTYEQMLGDEVLTFRTNCPGCNAPADTNMKLTKIPHFKEVVIMATVCDACGHKTNEVKSGGGIEERGVRFEVRVRGREDFSRDILKSETCAMSIPCLELSVGGRALGGRFTTTEGLLLATVQQLKEAPRLAAAIREAGDVERVIEQLQQVLECKREVTLVLDDPAGNSYVQSLNDDGDTPDEGLKISRYERSYEQNEELGLNDMRTEGYQREEEGDA